MVTITFHFQSLQAYNDRAPEDKARAPKWKGLQTKPLPFCLGNDCHLTILAWYWIYLVEKCWVNARRVSFALGTHEGWNLRGFLRLKLKSEAVCRFMVRQLCSSKISICAGARLPQPPASDETTQNRILKGANSWRIKAWNFAVVNTDHLGLNSILL